MQCLNLKLNTRWWKASLKTEIWVSVREDYEQTSRIQTSAVTMICFETLIFENAAQQHLIWEWIWQRFSPLFLVHKWRKRLIVGSERIMWHSDCVCLNDGYTACSDVTYVPSTRHMFDIVLGAQARSHVTVVQFFGDYLNLQHSTAGREGRDTREDQVREGRQQRTLAEASKSN